MQLSHHLCQMAGTSTSTREDAAALHSSLSLYSLVYSSVHVQSCTVHVNECVLPLLRVWASSLGKQSRKHCCSIHRRTHTFNPSRPSHMLALLLM